MFFVLKIISRFVSKRNFKKFHYYTFSTFSVICILEFIMALGFGNIKTYHERNYNKFRSTYDEYLELPYLKYHPYQIIPNKKKEFSFERKANSQGYIDMEWEKDKSENEKRWIALGDSFTEGDGAPFDSSYVASLRRMLPVNNTIMNAGVCGSDPIYNFKTFNDLLLPYHPDIVLQTISIDDMYYDIYIRGGLERFQPNGEVKYNNKPWWEPIYKYSFVSRIFFRMFVDSEMLIKRIDNDSLEHIILKIKDLVNRYDQLAENHQFKLYIILLPQFNLIPYYKDFHFNDFKFIEDHVQTLKHTQIIDLRDCFDIALQGNIDSLSQYYWPIDFHLNSKGYEIMAKCILKEVK